jgi:hypothetical protein
VTDRVTARSILSASLDREELGDLGLESGRVEHGRTFTQDASLDGSAWPRL